MRASVTFQEWSKETLRLAGLRPGTLETEQPFDGALLLVLRRPEDGRQLNIVIRSESAAREVLSGILLAFPSLREDGP